MTNRRVTATEVAGSVPFDNSTNGFIADNVQAAIEEMKTLFSPFNIITHTKNAAGHDIKLYDAPSNAHINGAPLVVIDNNGDIVMKEY